jgi:ubiquinone/menaquinone biosynthesis C-methylase UbiE
VKKADKENIDSGARAKEDDPIIVDKTNHVHEQKLVDEWHRRKSAFWAEVYQRKDLFAFLVQQRLVTALNYVDELSLPKTTRALEIGCGAGFMAVALAEKGFTVTAIDSLPEMTKLTRARARQTDMDNRIHTTIGDAHELAFQDQSFDLIIALGVIPWLHNLRKALVEITRVLIPGGYVVLDTSNRDCLMHLLDPLSSPAFEPIRKGVKRGLERAGLYNSWKRAEQHYYSIKDFNAYLREVNLTNIRNTNIGFGPFRLLQQNIFPNRIELRIHQKLQQYADSGFPILRSTGREFIVLARKK